MQCSVTKMWEYEMVAHETRVTQRRELEAPLERSLGAMTDVVALLYQCVLQGRSKAAARLSCAYKRYQTEVADWQEKLDTFDRSQKDDRCD